MWVQNMHANKFMIRLRLEILLQFTHEEEKNYMSNREMRSIFFLKSFKWFRLLHKISDVCGFCFTVIDEIEEGFTCIRKKSHVL